MNINLIFRLGLCTRITVMILFILFVPFFIVMLFLSLFVCLCLFHQNLVLLMGFLVVLVVLMVVVVDGLKSLDLGIDPYFFFVVMQKEMIYFVFVDR